MLNLTSGGIDSGARPICDGRFVEEENNREVVGNAGRRNEGIERVEMEATDLSSPFDRLGRSISVIQFS